MKGWTVLPIVYFLYFLFSVKNAQNDAKVWSLITFLSLSLDLQQMQDQ